MWVGDVLADRFVIERQIGSGGMGTVFIAADRETGVPVAVKVLDLVSEEGAVDRFRREARVLAELSHPGIVRYVAHGETEQREPYLVMEWLEGQDLSQSLRRGGLSETASVAVVLRAAEALAFAHAQGVVHRDIKPSNLFLVAGNTQKVKVLDFGIAKTRTRSRDLTGTGALLGTFGYMAPEQLMGSWQVDARADVFSLGCVLFECLTGRPAFGAEHAVAIIAKLLAAEVPRASSVRPELGAEFDELIAKMLAKEPRERFADAAEVAQALEQISSATQAIPQPPSREVPRLTHSERKVVTIVLSERASFEAASTMLSTEKDPDFPRIEELAKKYMAEARPLSGGAFIVVFSGGTATDQVAQAASLSLALRRLKVDFRIAVATGSSDATGHFPTGPAIDRAAALLQLLRTNSSWSVTPIALDTVAGGLIGPRFVVAVKDHLHLLQGERVEFDAPRLLLGKETPCVGREKELSLLELTLREVIDDSIARSVLVTAPAGVGKSRLCSEFLSRARSLGKARILLARADSVASGSPLFLARQLIRRAAGLLDADSETAQRERLRRFVSEMFGARAHEVFFEFLSELAGCPAQDAPIPLLVAARNDPAVMREQKRRAFAKWLDSQLSTEPTVIVIEDLHWGDAPSVSYLDEGLRKHPHRPFMVLGLARPEVHDAFPEPFPELQEIRLPGLTPRAAERLVRAVLGADVRGSKVAGIVQRADGNAFYLEELIRRAGENDESLPETVLAMAQSRLERLESQARRVLRAASVFGETCWVGGVATMLGASVDAAAWLDSLVDREILVRRGETRFSGEREFAFRHSLLRDAAYSMLTDEDRVGAHRAAGDWLEQAGEKDPRILADHFERGAEKERATRWMARAAWAAWEAGDLETAMRLADRGLGLGATGEDRGVLLLVRASAIGAQATGSLAASAMAQEALTDLRPGEVFWWRALGAVIWLTATGGKADDAAPYVQLALNTAPAEPSGPFGEAILLTLGALPHYGMIELARTFVEQFDSSEFAERGKDPLFSAWIDVIRSELACNMPHRDAWQLENAARWARAGAEIMTAAGSVFGEMIARFHLGTAYSHIGKHKEAAAEFHRLVALARRNGHAVLLHFADFGLSFSEIRSGRTKEALSRLLSIHTLPDKQIAHLSLCASAMGHIRDGNFEEALRVADEPCNGPLTYTRRWAKQLRASALFAFGRFTEALETANSALEELGQVNAEIEAHIYAIRAASLFALGHHDEARASIGKGRDLLLDVARAFEDADLRESFLNDIEYNRGVLSIAEQWLGPQAEG